MTLNVKRQMFKEKVDVIYTYLLRDELGAEKRRVTLWAFPCDKCAVNFYQYLSTSHLLTITSIS